MFEINNLIRKNIKRLKPYSSARDEFTGKASVYLDANESPFDTGYNRYPDPYQNELKRKIGMIKDIPVENIFLGNGSDEIIDLLFRAFCEPKQDNVIIMPPTYGMYSVCADINDVPVKEVNLKRTPKPTFILDTENVEKHIDQNTKLIFICSPNNPTGNAFQHNEIEEVIDIAYSKNCIVVVDEAYIDFCDEKSILPKLNNFKNLIVLQTFSKAWGLAGIRLGMAFTTNNIVKLLSGIKIPYNVNQLTQQHALLSLRKANKKNEKVKQILQQRNILIDRLKQLNYVHTIFPTDANFILIQVDDAQKLYKYLIDKGIVIRDRSNVALCTQCVRITIGTDTENTQLIDAMKTFQNIDKK